MFKKMEIVDRDQNCISIVPEELERRCRTCLTNVGVINLFLTKHDEIMFKDMFIMFSLPEVDASDGLPQKLCGVCAKMLLEFYSFKRQTEQIQELLLVAIGKYTFSNTVQKSEDEETVALNEHDEEIIYVQVDEDQNIHNIEQVDNDSIKSENSNCVMESSILKSILLGQNEKNKDQFYVPFLTCVDCQLIFKTQADYLNHQNEKIHDQKKMIEKVTETYNAYDLKCCVVEDAKFEYSNLDENISSSNEEKDNSSTIETEGLQFADLTNCIQTKVKIDNKNDTENNSHHSNIVCKGEIGITCTNFDHKFNSWVKHHQHRQKGRELKSCSVCNKKILSYRMERHLFLHEKNKCKKSLMLIDPQTGEVSCNTCNAKFKTELEYCLHGRYRRTVVKEANPMNKVKRRVSYKKYPCLICGQHFSSSTINDHMNVHTKQKPYMCEVCGVTFCFKSSLRLHTHTKWLCERCGKIFSSYHIFSVHFKSDHLGIRPHACDICAKGFAKKEQLTVHMRFHTGERPYLCTMCGKNFIQNAHLITHVKNVHDAEKHKQFRQRNRKRNGIKYVCDVCNKISRSRQSLKVHKRIHTGEKPYNCKDCGKHFTQSGHLDFHARIHTGEKHFKCPYCEKRFTLNGNLTQHIRMHTGDRPFLCDLCQKSFLTSSSLRKHKKIHEKM